MGALRHLRSARTSRWLDLQPRCYPAVAFDFIAFLTRTCIRVGGLAGTFTMVDVVSTSEASTPSWQQAFLIGTTTCQTPSSRTFQGLSFVPFDRAW